MVPLRLSTTVLVLPGVASGRYRILAGMGTGWALTIMLYLVTASSLAGFGIGL